MAKQSCLADFLYYLKSAKYEGVPQGWATSSL